MTKPEQFNIASSSTKSAPKTVLLVDDEVSVLTLWSDYVRTLGHIPLTATTADEALRILISPAGAAVDTVLVDIVMPGHDGTWLIERLGTHYPRLRVVIATGLAELDARVSLKPNVIAYLVKPFDVEELRVALDIGDE